MSGASASASPVFVLATRNRGKLRELRALFATRGLSVIDLDEAGVEERAAEEDAVEAFGTFEENALAKARYYAVRAPGRVMLADDSGLEVDALGGEPGVRSKRWSLSAVSPHERSALGTASFHERSELMSSHERSESGSTLAGGALVAANNALLIERLRGVSDRRARFVCAAAWCDGVVSHVVRGVVAGHITDVPQGVHGFGYDPHFFVDELGMTMAEATVSEKERVSHRGRAFVRLLDEIAGGADAIGARA